MPFARVTAHYAQSLDGRLAIDRSTTVLSTPEGQRAAHVARAAHDAVVVGKNTVHIDDPRLTVRHAEGADPIRVVLASTLDVPLEPRPARVLDRRGRVIVFGARGRADAARVTRLEDAGAEVRLVEATSDGLVSLPDVLASLASEGARRVLVEGGARVLTSFFRARLVHHVEIEIAMRFLGAPATNVFGALGVAGLVGAPSLVDVTVDRLGASLLVRGVVA
jgi:riboflavin-specific deaminase-like protein